MWTSVAIPIAVLVIPIAVLVAVVLLALVVIFVYWFCRMRVTTDPSRVQRREETPEVAIDMTGTSDQTKLVLFEKSYNFDVDDLLSSGAETLGEGSLGTAYKKEIKGLMVFERVLKRVAASKEVFENQMERIGKVGPHQNVSHLHAFYYSTLHKSLVYDYYPAARSLTTVMDGSLDWHSRVGIVHGIARGIAHIHSTGDLTFTHGNIIPSNVLIGQDGVARVINTGLLPIMQPPPTPSFSSGGYRAPEVLESGEHTPKSDVYSFGIILLEMLTGNKRILTQDINAWILHSMKKINVTGYVGYHKVPGEIAKAVSDMGFNVENMRFNNVPDVRVQILLNIGLECSASDPDNRPNMRAVLRRFDHMLQPGEPSEAEKETDENSDETSEPEKREKLLQAASGSSQTDIYAKAKIEDPTQLLPKTSLKVKKVPSTGELYCWKFFEDDYRKTEHLAEAVAAGEKTAGKLYRIRNKELYKALGEDHKHFEQIHKISKCTIHLLSDKESDLCRQSYIQLMGTVDQVRTAELLILNKILQAYKSNGTDFPVILMPPSICEHKRKLPLNKIERLKGPEGNYIMEIEILSSAWIEINEGPDCSESERMVHIYGPHRQVVEALGLINISIFEPGESMEAENEFSKLVKELTFDENEKSLSDEEAMQKGSKKKAAAASASTSG